MSVLRSSQSTRIPFQKSVNKSENHTTSTAAQKQPSKRQDASSTFDSAENLVRWTTSHLRRPKSRSALARPMEVKNRSRNEDVVPEEANTQNSESSLSSSVTSTHSMTTDQSHTSIEEVTDTSESEFHDSPSREMSPPPFSILYRKIWCHKWLKQPESQAAMLLLRYPCPLVPRPSRSSGH